MSKGQPNKGDDPVSILVGYQEFNKDGSSKRSWSTLDRVQKEAPELTEQGYDIVVIVKPSTTKISYTR
jgi:hypothetical protein